jgi:CBS-domain-containing membrane protein
MSRISPQRATRTTNKADSGPPGLMYRFLECTVGQYMTRDVTIVTRQVTLRDLEALFEKHDFNSFPVVEEGKMLGIVTKFDFLKAFVFTTGQMVPHYDELMKRRRGNDDRSRHTCRTNHAIDSRSMLILLPCARRSVRRWERIS